MSSEVCWKVRIERDNFRRHCLDLVVNHFKVSSKNVYLVTREIIDTDMPFFDTFASMLDSYCDVQLFGWGTIVCNVA